MSNENNHELTRVQFREEVERSLDSLLPSNLPAKQKREAATRVEQIFERYSSPYPDPNFLAQIERLAPGSAAEIVAETRKDLDHRRDMDIRRADHQKNEIGLVRHLADVQIGSVKQGRLLGFFAYLACLIFSATMYMAGSETLALAGFGAAALGIIAQLIRGGGTGISITSGPEDKELKPSKDVRQQPRR